MNPLVSNDWTDELDDFYDRGQFYSDYQSLSFFDDLINPAFNTGKIVELIDTGCDARASRLDGKNNKCTKNPPRASNFRDSKTKKSVEAKVARRSSDNTRATRSQYLPSKTKLFEEDSLAKDDADSLNKTSLDNLVVSSITFNVADRETKDDDFEDFEDVDEMEFRELQNRKRFTDRAVDSDCLSDFSRPSMDNNPSASSTTVNLRRKNVEVRTRETTSSKASSKKLRKSNESVDDKSRFTKNPRAKISRWSRTSGPSSTVRNSRDTKNVRSKINIPQSGRTLESVSRTIIKDQKVRVKKERSEIPRPIIREGGCTLKRDNNRNAKKSFVAGSRLPVWQGRHRKIKIAPIFDNSRTNVVKDENEVGGNFNPASRMEGNYSEEEIRKIDKNRKIIIEDDVKKSENVSAQLSKPGESADQQRVKFEREEVGGQSEVKNRAEIEGDVEKRGIEETKGIVETESGAESKDITGSKVAPQSKVEDQSKSDLWSKNYEEAFAKGRAVGLRVYKMAKAAREERKREFRKYGFEDYKRIPREMPQEIVDIGVTLLEKVLDDGKQNYHKRNCANVRDRVS